MGTRQIPKYEHKCDRCSFQVESTNPVPPSDWQNLEWSSNFGGNKRKELFCAECMKVIHPVKSYEIQVPLSNEELQWILRKIYSEAVITKQMEGLGHKMKNAINAINALQEKEANGPG